MNKIFFRAARFVVWLTLFALLVLQVPSALALYGNTAPAGIVQDLPAKTPSQEGDTITLHIETNVNVAYPGCFHWFKGTTRITTQSDAPILDSKGNVLGYQSTVTIAPATKADSGLYYCDVQGTDGSLVRTSMSQYLIVTTPNLVLTPKSQLVVNKNVLRLRVDPKYTAQAALNSPGAVVIDRNDENTGYVIDTNNHLIRRMGPGGDVSLFAGTTGSLQNLQMQSGGTGYFSLPIAIFDGKAGAGFQVQNLGATNGIVSVASGSLVTVPRVPALKRSEVRYIEAPNLYIIDKFGGFDHGALAKVDYVSGKGYQDTATGFELTNAKFDSPEGAAVSPDGKLYIADTNNHVIRMIDLRADNPIVTTVAGLAGSAGFADGLVGYGAAAKATVAGGTVNSITITNAGTDYVSDLPPTVTFSVPTDQFGNGFELPGGVAATATASVAGYVSDVSIVSLGTGGYHTPPNIVIDPPKDLTGTLIPTGIQATGTATIASGNLIGIKILNAGSGYLTAGTSVAVTIIPQGGDAPATPATAKATVRAGLTTITPLTAGTGYTFPPMVTITGGNPTRLNKPRGLKVDKSGNVIIADSDNHAIRLLRPIYVDPADPSQGLSYQLSTIAGSKPASAADPVFGNKDGPGISSAFYGPRDIAIDNQSGHYYVYVSDYINHTIRRIEMPVDAAGELVLPPINQDLSLNTLAGSVKVITYAGQPGAAAYVNGSSKDARFIFPAGLEMDTQKNDGTLFISEVGNNTIRRATPTTSTECSVSTYAGSESRIAGNLDGPSGGALFYYPKGIAFDSLGNLFIAERGSHDVRMVSAKGDTVSTFAGITGIPGQFDTPNNLSINSEFFYQWSKDGAPLKEVPADGIVKESIVGTTTQTLTIAGQDTQVNFGNLADRNSGLYSVQVSSGYKGNWSLFTQSLPAKVTVKNTDFPPIEAKAKVGNIALAIDISKDVANAIFSKTGLVLSNANYTFSSLDGGAIPSWMVQVGAGSPLFQVTPPPDQGSQTVILNLTVSDSLANLKSLLIIDIAPFDSDNTQKPLITTPPQFQMVKQGSDAAALSVQAQGVGLTYQWYKNGTALAGETNATLTRNQTTLNDGAFYSVKVSNSKGTVESTPAQLVVVSGPEVVTQPASIVLTKDPLDSVSTQTLSVSPLTHTKSLFNFPLGLALNRTTSELYIADQKNSQIRKVQLGGNVSAVAGSAGQPGDTDSTGVGARFSEPSNISIGTTGDILIADTQNDKIRRLTSPDAVTSVISGLNKPQAVVADPKGNLYISDTGNHVIRTVHTVEAVIGVTITDGGSGFPNSDTATGANLLDVRFSDLDKDGNPTGGIGARGVGIVKNGTVVAVNILNPGTGYKKAPVVKFYSTTSSTTELDTIVATANISGTISDSVKIVNGGAGYKASPTVELVGGGVEYAAAVAKSDITGAVRDVTITNPGAGYSSAPEVVFVPDTTNLLPGDQGGGGAAATATVLNGKLISIKITNSGSGYTNSPFVKLVGGGIQKATANVSMGVGQIALKSPGAGYGRAPVVVIEGGGGTGAKAVSSVGLTTASVVDNSGLSLSGNGVKTGGTGYTGAETFNYTFLGGTFAVNPVLSAVFGAPGSLDADKVIRVNVTHPGSGFTADNIVPFSITATPVGITPGTGFSVADPIIADVSGGRYSAQPSVSIKGGGGVGAQARAIMGVGEITSNPLTDGGSGYVSPPTVTFSGGGGAGAAATAIMGISDAQVTDGGSGYTSAPGVHVVSGGGSGASAQALMGINSVVVGARGAGYSNPPAVSFDWGTNAGSYTYGAGTWTLFNPGNIYSAGSIQATGNAITGTLTFAILPGQEGQGYAVPPSISVVPDPADTTAVFGGTISVGVDAITGSLVASSLSSTSVGQGFFHNPTVVVGQPDIIEAIIVGTVDASAADANGKFHLGTPQLKYGGKGYKEKPTVSITGGSGTNASVSVVWDATTQSITSISLDSPGQNYNSTDTVTFTVSGPARATAVMGLPVTSGSYGNSILQVNPGTNQGFFGPPSITLTGGGSPTLFATGTAIMGVNQITGTPNPGNGPYSLPPLVVFSGGTAAGGTYATAVAKIGVNTVTVGTGGVYTTVPQATFTGGSLSGGTHASAIPVMGIGTVTLTTSDNLASGPTRNFGYTAKPSSTSAAGYANTVSGVNYNIDATMGVSGWVAGGTPTARYTLINGGNIPNGGSYSAPPTVTFPAPTSGITASGSNCVVGVGLGSLVASGGSYSAAFVAANNPSTSGIPYFTSNAAPNVLGNEIRPTFASFIPHFFLKTGSSSVTGAISITNGGVFTGKPALKLDNSLTNGAACTAVMGINGGTVSGVSAGTAKFYSMPTISFDATAGGTLASGSIAATGLNFVLPISVTGTGTGYRVGGALNGTGTVQLVGGGSGTAVATLAGGTITSISVTPPAGGWTALPATIVSGGTQITIPNTAVNKTAFASAVLGAFGFTTGTGAQIDTPYMSVTSGTAFVITNPGRDYVGTVGSGNTVTISAPTPTPIVVSLGTISSSGTALSKTGPSPLTSLATLKIVDTLVTASGSDIAGAIPVTVGTPNGGQILAPTIQIANLVMEKVTGLTASNGGRGYTTANPMNFRAITPPGGTEATLGLSYKVTDVGIPWTPIPNPAVLGSGYTTTTGAPGSLIFSTNTGSGANANFGLCFLNLNVTAKGSSFTGVGSLTPAGSGVSTTAPNHATINIGYITVVSVGVQSGVATGNYGTVPGISFTPAGATATPSSLGVSAIVMTSPGYGYVSRPTIQITKDPNDPSTVTNPATGFSVLDLKMVGVSITSGGSGYTRRDNLGGVVSSTAASGTGWSFPNGLIGRRDTPFKGMELIGVTVSDSGRSYSNVPTRVKIARVGSDIGSPNITQDATASVSDLKVTAIKILDKGSGYTDTPVISIDAPAVGDRAKGIVSGMKVVYLRLDKSGTGYTTLPSITIAGGAGSGAVGTVKSLKVLKIDVTNPGRNYTTAPTSIDIIRAGGDVGFDATEVAVAQIPSGLGVNGITITDSGTGYTSLPSVRLVDDGQGSGAAATVVGLTVNKLLIDSHGGGYATAPAVKITPTPTQVEGNPTKFESVGDGATAIVQPIGLLGLANISVVDKGSNYVAAPSVVITGGGGNGATATAQINGGEVIGITLTDSGNGYTSTPTVTLVGGTGASGTVATAIAKVREPIYTIGGLGRDPGLVDGDVSSSVLFNSPRGLGLDRNGVLYVCDTGNSVIRRIVSPLVADKNGRRTFKVSTLAGLGGARGAVDGAGSLARFSAPEGIIITPEGVPGVPTGTIYVTDTGNNLIRRITSEGSVFTVVGIANQAGKTDGNASIALFNNPKGIDIDMSGNLYIADQANHAIRKVTMGTQPTVSTIAGVLGLAGASNSDGVNEYSYQWRRDGLPIEGANSSSYQISNLNGVAGSYDVVITNVAGAVASSPGLVRVRQQTTVVQDLKPTTVLQGRSAALEVVVTAFPVPTFQWYRKIGGNWEQIIDGPDWSGATTSKLTLLAAGTGPDGASAGAQPGHSGLYKVKIGATTESSTVALTVLHKPILGNTLRNVRSMSSKGSHSLAIHQDNTLWSWGYNAQSQLGNGGTDPRPIPLQVGTSQWARISTGNGHSVGISTTGALFAWGNNDYGQVGNSGSNPVYDTVHQIGTENFWLEISAGNNHNLAIRADRYYGPKTSATGWGTVQGGTLQSHSLSKEAPRNPAPTAAWIKGSGAPTDAIGNIGDYYVDTSAGGTLWGWGANDYGQLGDDPSTVILSPQQIVLPAITDPSDPSGKRLLADQRDVTWKAISAGGEFSVALQSDGSVLSWGRNDRGQLGNGTLSDNSTPTVIDGITITNISAGQKHVLATTSSGALLSWGANESSQLGQSTNGLPEMQSVIPRPVNVSVLDNSGVPYTWTAVAAGTDHSVAIDQNGGLWVWGANNRGQLGLGSLAQTQLPTQLILSVPDRGIQFTSIVAGDRQTLASTADGMLWSWGANDYGQIGNGTKADNVTQILVTAGGTGYTAATQVVASGISASPVIENGVITAVNILNPGSGLTSAPAIQFDDQGGGTGAVAQATMDQISPVRIGGMGPIFVGADNKPLTFYSTPTQPGYAQIAVLESGANSANTTYVWKQGSTNAFLGFYTRLPLNILYTRTGTVTEAMGLGSYTLTVNNDQGSTVSNPILVMYLPNEGTDVVPVANDPFGADQTLARGADITIQAPKLKTFPGDPGAPYNIPSYQWSYYANKGDLIASALPNNVSGGTSSTLLIKGGSITNTGVYKVQVSLKFGNQYSLTAANGLGDPIIKTYTASEYVQIVDAPVVSLATARSLPISVRTGSGANSTLSPIQLIRGDAVRLGVDVTSNTPTSLRSILLPPRGIPGYSNPTINISGGGATVNATATPTVTAGTITAITIVNRGEGYTTAPTVTITEAGKPSNTSAIAVLETGVVYKWFKDGTLLPNKNSPQLDIITSITDSSADSVNGAYSVTVSNVAGETPLSDPTTGDLGIWNITAHWAPAITVQPTTAIEAVAGANVQFSVGVDVSNKSDLPVYQWYFNNQAITEGDSRLGATGVNTATLKLSNVSLQNVGQYQVRITNSLGAVTSSATTGKLNVIDALVAPSLPATAMRGAGNYSQGKDVELTVIDTVKFPIDPTKGETVLTRRVQGRPLSYQWYRDRVVVPGATGPTLTIPAIQTSQAGTYTVVIWNDAGSVTGLFRVVVGKVANADPNLRLATVQLDSSVPISQFFTLPIIPANGKLPVGTRLRLFGQVTPDKSLRGYIITNTPVGGTPTSVVVSGAFTQFVLGAGTTVITPKVGRSFAGTYSGLLSTDRPWFSDGSASSVNTATTVGLATASVTSTNAVSGQINLQGTTYRFATSLDSTGLGTFVLTTRPTTITGTVQLDAADNSVDGSMRIQLGNEARGVPVSVASNGTNTVSNKVIYSLAACNAAAVLSDPNYTAAISRRDSRGDSWTNLGRGGCFSIAYKGGSVIIFGYLGNGNTFAYTGTPVSRFPDGEGKIDWEALSSQGAVADSPMILAAAAMNEVFTQQSTSVFVPIYTQGDNGNRPLVKPLVGGMVFSSQGIVGSIGMIDIGATSVAPSYTANLIRGWAYQTSQAIVNTTAITFASPFDQDQGPANLFSSVSYPPDNGYSWAQKQAIDTLLLQTTNTGSSFVHRNRTSNDPIVTTAVSPVSGGTVGIGAIKWISSSGTTSSTPDSGLFNVSFNETNTDFSVASTRTDVNPVIFSNNQATVKTRVYGVTLQSDGSHGVSSGGYGFLIRGTPSETLSNTLGLGEVEAATNASTPSIKTYRTEAIMLLPQ